MFYTDIQNIIAFYASEQGINAKQIITHHIKKYITPANNKCILGYGFCQPYIEQLEQLYPHWHTLVFHAKKYGASYYHTAPKKDLENIQLQKTQYNASVLIDENHFPLAKNTIDIIFAIHSLEFSVNYRNVIAEMLRVLRPQGQIIVIIPNKRKRLPRYPHFSASIAFTFQEFIQALKKEPEINTSSIIQKSISLRNNIKHSKNSIPLLANNKMTDYLMLSLPINPFSDLRLLSFHKTSYNAILDNKVQKIKKLNVKIIPQTH